jgi:hypothetical protein
MSRNEFKAFHGSFPANRAREGDLQEQHRLFLRDGGLLRVATSEALLLSRIFAFFSEARAKIREWAIGHCSWLIE